MKTYVRITVSFLSVVILILLCGCSSQDLQKEIVEYSELTNVSSWVINEGVLYGYRYDEDGRMEYLCYDIEARELSHHGFRPAQNVTINTGGVIIDDTVYTVDTRWNDDGSYDIWLYYYTRTEMVEKVKIATLSSSYNRILACDGELLIQLADVEDGDNIKILYRYDPEKKDLSEVLRNEEGTNTAPVYYDEIKELLYTVIKYEENDAAKIELCCYTKDGDLVEVQDVTHLFEDLCQEQFLMDFVVSGNWIYGQNNDGDAVLASWNGEQYVPVLTGDYEFMLSHSEAHEEENLFYIFDTPYILRLDPDALQLKCYDMGAVRIPYAENDEEYLRYTAYDEDIENTERTKQILRMDELETYSYAAISLDLENPITVQNLLEELNTKEE